MAPGEIRIGMVVRLDKWNRGYRDDPNKAKYLVPNYGTIDELTHDGRTLVSYKDGGFDHWDCSWLTPVTPLEALALGIGED